jgi:hypothetical protein
MRNVVEDYYPWKRFCSASKRKEAKKKSFPCAKLEELLDQYLKATGLEKEPQAPLFPAANPQILTALEAILSDFPYRSYSATQNHQ